MPGATDTDFFNKAGAENTKQVTAHQLADPAEVAKDGYEALMNKDTKVISGMKNKLQAALSNVTPDAAGATAMRKLMETDGDDK